MINPKLKLMSIGIINAFVFMCILFLYTGILPSYLDTLPYLEIIWLVSIIIIFITNLVADYFRLKRLYLEIQEDTGIKKRYFVLPILGILIVLITILLVLFCGYFMGIYIPVSLIITLVFPIYVFLKISKKIYLYFKHLYVIEIHHKFLIIVGLIIFIVVIFFIGMLIGSIFDMIQSMYDAIALVGLFIYFIIDSISLFINSIIIYNKFKHTTTDVL